MLNSSLAWRTGDLSGRVEMPGNVGCYPDNVDSNPGRGFALQATHLTFHASGLRPSKKNHVVHRRGQSYGTRAKCPCLSPQTVQGNASSMTSSGLRPPKSPPFPRSRASLFWGVTAPINVDHHAESGAIRANYVAGNGIYDRDA